MGLEQPEEQKNSEENFDQQKHPEIKEGERWVMNVSTQNENKVLNHYESKRVGRKAYLDSDGSEMHDMRPVFVSIEEYEEKDKKEE